MAITVVQSTAKQAAINVITLNISLPSVVAGNTILVAFFSYAGGGINDAVGVTDGDGKYTRDVYYKTQGNGSACIFRLVNASAGTHAIVVNLVANTYANIVVMEVSGMIVTECTSQNRGSSTTPTTLATRTTQIADELVIAIMAAEANQASITVEVTTPPWIQAIEELSYSTSVAGEIDYKIVSANAAYTANWTLVSTCLWTCAICTYMQRTSGGGSSGGEVSVVF